MSEPTPEQVEAAARAIANAGLTERLAPHASGKDL